MSYADTDRALTVLKRQPETGWLNEVASVPLQQSLRDLQTAFTAFFTKRCAYPTFKKKGGRATARYTRLNGFKMKSERQLWVAKIGTLRVRWDRTLSCYPSSMTIIRKTTGRYYVSFVVEVNVSPFPKTGKSVGIDFGLARLATLSTGERIANPRYFHRTMRRIAWLQRRVARRQKGSKRRILAQRAVARCYEKVGNCRRDMYHKLASRLLREFDMIYIEDLNLRGWAKNHSLARSANDASIGLAIRMLEEKAEMYGKKVMRIDRFFPSSKLCSSCGHVLSVLDRGTREWTCPNCTTHHDRDLNAAKNILAVGQTVAAHGDGVRAVAAPAAKANYP